MKVSSGALGMVAAIAAFVIGGALAITAAGAQVVTGTLGQPSATTTIPGNQIPAPDPPFGGVIKETRRVEGLVAAAHRAPEGRAERSADHDRRSGLRRQRHLRRRHPDPDPRRAGAGRAALHAVQLDGALLTVARRADHRPQPPFRRLRRYHRALDGFPGYDSIIGPEDATIGRILKDNGYATSWFGKNHNTPDFEYTVAGPFDQWPSGMGFDYFYGFMGGETDQWTPYLFENNRQVFPWVGKEGNTTSPPTWPTRPSTICRA